MDQMTVERLQGCGSSGTPEHLQLDATLRRCPDFSVEWVAWDVLYAPDVPLLDSPYFLYFVVVKKSDTKGIAASRGVEGIYKLLYEASSHIHTACRPATVTLQLSPRYVQHYSLVILQVDMLGI